jgi:hypothetical protein
MIPKEPRKIEEIDPKNKIFWLDEDESESFLKVFEKDLIIFSADDLLEKLGDGETELFLDTTYLSCPSLFYLDVIIKALIPDKNT